METMDTNSVPWRLQRVAEDEAGEVDGRGVGWGALLIVILSKGS